MHIDLMKIGAVQANDLGNDHNQIMLLHFGKRKNKHGALVPAQFRPEDVYSKIKQFNDLEHNTIKLRLVDGPFPGEQAVQGVPENARTFENHEWYEHIDKRLRYQWSAAAESAAAQETAEVQAAAEALAVAEAAEAYENADDMEASGDGGQPSSSGSKRTLDSSAASVASEEDASKKQRVSPPAETNDELRLMYEKQIEDLKAKHENEMGNILIKYDALIEERTKAAEKIKELNDALRVERTVTDDVDTKIRLVRQQNTHLSAKILAMQMERETLMRTMAELQKKPSPAQPQLSNPNTDASEVPIHTPPAPIQPAEF